MNINKLAFYALLVGAVIAGYLILQFIGQPGEWALAGLLAPFLGHKNRHKVKDSKARQQVYADMEEEAIQQADEHKNEALNHHENALDKAHKLNEDSEEDAKSPAPSGLERVDMSSRD